MPQIRIHPHTPKEAKSLYSMNHAYFTEYTWQMDRKIGPKDIAIQFHHVRLPRQIIVEPPRTIAARRAANLRGNIALIAVIEDSPVAYTVLEKKEQTPIVRIVDFVVKQKNRRQGIGSSLLLAAQDWSLSEGCQRIVVEIQSKNHPAIQLAKKMGYDYCGFHEYYYANHDIVLFFASYLR